jgi:hypothetical protein
MLPAGAAGRDCHGLDGDTEGCHLNSCWKLAELTVRVDVNCESMWAVLARRIEWLDLLSDRAD